MSRFAPGDKVLQTRGTFLHQGVFVTPRTVFTVLAVKGTGPDATCDMQYLDRESIPHTIEGMKESELKPAG